jgi:hypothetical protein
MPYWFESADTPEHRNNPQIMRSDNVVKWFAMRMCATPNRCLVYARPQFPTHVRKLDTRNVYFVWYHDKGSDIEISDLIL